MDGPARPLAVGEDLYAVWAWPAMRPPKRSARHTAATPGRAIPTSPEVTEARGTVPPAGGRLRSVGSRRRPAGLRSCSERRLRGRRHVARVLPPRTMRPGPSWNPAVRGPAAQSCPPATGRLETPAPPRPERTSTDEWRLGHDARQGVRGDRGASCCIAFGTMVAGHADQRTERRRRCPRSTARPPDGWLDCRQALDPAAQGPR